MKTAPRRRCFLFDIMGNKGFHAKAQSGKKEKSWRLCAFA
jgi:hypothetical protein